MEFLNEYIVPVVLGICLCIGFIIKNYIKDVDNKHIPTIVSILGVFFAMWYNSWQISPEIILQGLVSGLSSTGLYELFRNTDLIEFVKSFIKKGNG